MYLKIAHVEMYAAIVDFHVKALWSNVNTLAVVLYLLGESSFLPSESAKNQIVYFVQKVCRFFTSVKCLCL